MDSGGAWLDFLERLRSASIAQDAERLGSLYAEDAVHVFPFVVPGAPERIEGRAAIIEFNRAASDLPFVYTEYRTIAVHPVSATTLVVEQEAVGTNTTTGAAFVLPNVWVIDVDADGLIAVLRDYVNPLAVADVLGEVDQSFAPR